MSEEFGLKDYLNSKFEEVQGSISGVHERLDKINGRVGKLETEQAESRGATTTWKWLAGIIGIPGMVAFIKTFLYAGK